VSIRALGCETLNLLAGSSCASAGVKLSSNVSIVNISLSVDVIDAVLYDRTIVVFSTIAEFVVAEYDVEPKLGSEKL